MQTYREAIIEVACAEPVILEGKDLDLFVKREYGEERNIDAWGFTENKVIFTDQYDGHEFVVSVRRNPISGGVL